VFHTSRHRDESTRCSSATVFWLASTVGIPGVALPMAVPAAAAAPPTIERRPDLLGLWAPVTVALDLGLSLNGLLPLAVLATVATLIAALALVTE